MITRLGLDGYGARRAGSFAGKTIAGGPITRLSLDAYGARRAGDFTGKETAVEIPPAVAGRTRRWKLPDGRVYFDYTEAYEALQAYLEARFTEEIASSRIKAKKGTPERKAQRKERRRLEQATLLLREIPLPAVLERLPAPVKARMDPDMVRLAAELAALNEEEDDIITLLFLM